MNAATNGSLVQRRLETACIGEEEEGDRLGMEEREEGKFQHLKACYRHSALRSLSLASVSQDACA